MIRSLVCFGVFWISQTDFVLSQSVGSVSKTTMLMFGDVNLGRQLGQELLRGNIDYPFKRMESVLKSADIVFANLESPISDQNGVTESPESNVVFCAPPIAATVLRKAGITIVSTANNHAFDYSLQGIRETIRYLDNEGIEHVGTKEDSAGRFEPAIVTRNGISIGFLAYTQFVNASGPRDGRVAVFDSLQARRDIERLKPKCDLVVVSFHGGKEYSDAPGTKTLRQLESLVRSGADIVVGHHPHVPQGIKTENRSIIFYSLGNFVFNQASPWAKVSFGAELNISKSHGTAEIESVRVIPLRAYKQPAVDLPSSSIDSLVARLRRLSNVPINLRNDSIFVSTTLRSH